MSRAPKNFLAYDFEMMRYHPLEAVVNPVNFSINKAA
jgi:hypothetical protein